MTHNHHLARSCTILHCCLPHLGSRSGTFEPSPDHVFLLWRVGVPHATHVNDTITTLGVVVQIWIRMVCVGVISLSLSSSALPDVRFDTRWRVGALPAAPARGGRGGGAGTLTVGGSNMAGTSTKLGKASGAGAGSNGPKAALAVNVGWGFRSRFGFGFGRRAAAAAAAWCRGGHEDST